MFCIGVLGSRCLVCGVVLWYPFLNLNEMTHTSCLLCAAKLFIYIKVYMPSSYFDSVN